MKFCLQNDICSQRSKRSASHGIKEHSTENEIFAKAKMIKNVEVRRAEMVERFKAHAWKACDVNASAGSNPVLCAKKIKGFPRNESFEGNKKQTN